MDSVHSDPGGVGPAQHREAHLRGRAAAAQQGEKRREARRSQLKVPPMTSVSVGKVSTIRRGWEGCEDYEIYKEGQEVWRLGE